MDVEPTGDAFVIRPSTLAERRSCRMLLPRATGASQRAQLYVAVSGAEQRIVGAAAVGVEIGPEDVGRRWLVDLRVIVPARGRGIGRALMQRVVEQASDHGIGRLHSWEWVEPDGETAKAWAAQGFAPGQRKLEFEADLSRAHDALLPYYERAKEDGWIPPSARIVPLADPDLDAVVRLHVQYLGGSRRLLLPLLRGTTPHPFDAMCSRVLLLDERVVGFTLGRIHPDASCGIGANVIHPGQRGANLSDAQLAEVFTAQLRRVRTWLANQANFKVLDVDYREVINDSAAQASRVNHFLGGPPG